MGNLYFDDSYGKTRLVAENVQEEDVMRLINDYVHFLSPSYVIHYVRVWGDKEKHYDVGSHSEFFRFVRSD